MYVPLKCVSRKSYLQLPINKTMTTESKRTKTKPFCKGSWSFHYFTWTLFTAYMTVQWISVDKKPPHCPLGSDLLNGLQNVSFELLGPRAVQIQLSVREFKYLGYIWRFCNNIKSKKATIWIAGIESWCLKWKIKGLWANVLSSMQQFV